MLASLLPARYAKAITAALGQALTVVQLIYGHNTYVAIALAAAAALGVYAIPNAQPPAPPPPDGTTHAAVYTLSPPPADQGYTAAVPVAYRSAVLAVRFARGHRFLSGVRRHAHGQLEMARTRLHVHTAAASRPGHVALAAAGERLAAAWYPATLPPPPAAQQLAAPRVCGGRITTLEAIRRYYDRADASAAAAITEAGWAVA